VTRADRNTQVLVEELELGSDPTSIIVLGEQPDEWQLALERVKCEERHWDEALRRARLGSEVPPDAGVRQTWDEEEEWAFRISFCRAEQDLGDLETLADEFVHDDDATVECAPCPELLSLSDHDDMTREIVIPPALLEAMVQ
jgi:hypothetical protein